MISKFKQIEEPLKQAISKMLATLMTPVQMDDHLRKLAEIQLYDKYQKKYIFSQKKEQHQQNECINQEQYDYDSDSEVEDNYKNLDQNQLKYLIRKKLVRLNHDPDKLQKIVIYDPQMRNIINTEQPITDSTTDINDCQNGQALTECENKLNQVNQIYLQELAGHKNLKALKFIIDELQRIQQPVL